MEMEAHRTVLPSLCTVVAQMPPALQARLSAWWASYDEVTLSALVDTLQQFITLRILANLEEEFVVNHDR